MFGFLARFILALLGWSVEGENPDIKKAVCVIAPHTSHWDWFFLLLTGWVFQQRFRYLVSDKEYYQAHKTLPLKITGGIPLNPKKSMVKTAVDYLNDADQLLLVISPEGQLAKTDYWHTGFYYMAKEANVPLVPVALDYQKQRIMIGEAVQISGDIENDVNLLSEHYDDVAGKYPHQFGAVRVRQGK
ncbi:MAG: 1-acyl-sn-glycerol-3-phosphate acyltransferase [Anaerolineae bacterium]|nr:1-acyl-sn-glycerol-3-phosphate acyltransferase [Anaerolineae bacterium]